MRLRQRRPHLDEAIHEAVGEMCPNPAPDIGSGRSHRGRTGPGNAVSQRCLRRAESAFLGRIGFRTQTGESLVKKSGRNRRQPKSPSARPTLSPPNIGSCRVLAEPRQVPSPAIAMGGAGSEIICAGVRRGLGASFRLIRDRPDRQSYCICLPVPPLRHPPRLLGLGLTFRRRRRKAGPALANVPRRGGRDLTQNVGWG